MIKYTERSMPVVDNGFYLVETSDKELTVAEWDGDEWSQIGADYDYWTYSSPHTIVVTVLCQLDLKKIAAGAKAAL